MDIKTHLINPRRDNSYRSYDDVLKAIGLKLSESTDGHPVTSVRYGPTLFIIGFKNLADVKLVSNFLIENGVEFNFTLSKGARYEYHIHFRK